MEKITKKVKKCLTEMIEHDKLKKSPREADKKSYKKDKKCLTEKMIFNKEIVTKELIQKYYTMAHRGNQNARFTFASSSTQFLYADIEKVLKELERERNI